MPERAFRTEWWSSAFARRLSMEARYLYIYLYYNQHCNQAGLYEITPSYIAFESGLPESSLPELMKSLEPEVKWYPDKYLVWVKSFMREQTKSPKFLVAAVKSLEKMNLDDDIMAEFRAFNESISGISIAHRPLSKRECVIIRDNFQCQYCDKELTESADYEVDHVIPSLRGGKDIYTNLVAACMSCNHKKQSRTPLEAGMPVPNPTSFHAAQATFILRNDPEKCRRWLEMFPYRYNDIDSILVNVDQYQTNIPSESESVSESETVNSSEGRRKGLGKGRDNHFGEVAKAFEAEIGRLTPMVGEALGGMVDEYGYQEVLEAIRITAGGPQKTLRYVQGTLKKRAEDRGKGGSTTKKDDPNKFIKGKYGHVVQR